LTIGSNVTQIGKQAFRDCSNLTSIVIPDKVQTVEYRAFGGCAGVTSITLGSYAFSGCIALEEIINKAARPQALVGAGSGNFDNTDKSFCILRVSSGSLAAYSGTNIWKDFKI